MGKANNDAYIQPRKKANGSSSFSLKCTEYFSNLYMLSSPLPLSISHHFVFLRVLSAQTAPRRLAATKPNPIHCK